MTNQSDNDRSCWTCAFQSIGGHRTFLGFCTRPATNNPTGEKQIPGEWVDKGCGKRVERKSNEPS